MDDKIAAVIVGAILGAFLTVVRDIWKEYRGKSSEAKFLAIQAVCLIDKFMEDSLKIAADDGLREGRLTHEGYKEAQVEEPAFEPYTLEVNWTSIDPTIMYNILALPSRVQSAQQQINFAAENGDGAPYFDDAFDERQLQFSRLAKSAFNIAKSLRTKYEIPERDDFDWDPLDFINKKIESIENKRLKQHESHLEMMHKLKKS